MSYQSHFEAIERAVKSLEVVPDTIKEFTKLLRQTDFRKPYGRDLTWVHKLCGKYHDNCYNYVCSIEEAIATEFLAKCLDTETDPERKKILQRLKGNLPLANRRLDRCLSQTERKEVMEKVDGVLSEMEQDQMKKDEKAKYFLKLSEWLKGELVQEVSEVFAKIIGPLWDTIHENFTKAGQDDYDHDALQSAVATIKKNVPKIEQSLELNKRALTSVKSVLESLEREEEQVLKQSLRHLYPMKDSVKNACGDMIKLLESLNS